MKRDVRRRGKCPVCGFSQRLLTNGMIAFHRVYSGNVGTACQGIDHAPKSDKAG